LLFEADRDVQLDRLAAAAAIQATICNTHNDWEKRPEGWVPANFMPGAKSERDELLEFAEAVARGDTFDEPDAVELERCRGEIEKTFSNII
jgi:hypothetical protein